MENQNIKKAGMKVTIPRVRILQLLEDSEHRHMSAEEVYKALLESGEDIGIATVYRVLTQFETAGLVSRHHFEGGASVFELKQRDHHDHMLCVKCGAIIEFVDEVIEQRQRVIAEQSGFSISDHSLYIYGTCKKCQKEILSSN
ncbi:MAG: ferric iron uptake transcriptional regulator [Gammaproteobacteria bacterium]|nr:ferric iron uptake transcriptional regulator [Gammaproteobacteria bacterium]